MEKKYTNSILVKFAIIINFEQKFSREIHQRYDHRQKEKKKGKMIYRANFAKTDDFPRIKTDSGCQEQGIIQRELFREAATGDKITGPREGT